MFETIEQHEVQDFGKPKLKDRIIKIALTLGVVGAAILAMVFFTHPA